MNDGWVKIHRSITKCWLWENPEYLQAWVDLIMMANYEPLKSERHGSIVHVERGQVLTSRDKLAKRWNWGVQKTRTFLKLLETDEKVTLHATNNYTLITLVNYKQYQVKETSAVTSPQPAHNQPITTSKKERRKELIYTPDFETFWRAYPRHEDKGDAFEKWNARLEGGVDPSLLILAATNYAAANKDTEKQYIKHGATFLSYKKPYEEWITPEQQPTGKGCKNPPPYRTIAEKSTLLDCGCPDCLTELERRNA
jgi:hypothetical protein